MTLLLGVIIGLSVALLMHQLSGNKRQLRTRYDDWRKLNLILQTVDDNYVDSVDRKKATDAAIEAVLATLDPHSVYMPPQKLEESEEDLSGNFSGIGIQFNVPKHLLPPLWKDFPS